MLELIDPFNDVSRTLGRTVRVVASCKLLVTRASSDPRASRQDKKSDWHDLALFHKSVEGYNNLVCRNSSSIRLQSFNVDGAKKSFDCNPY